MRNQFFLWTPDSTRPCELRPDDLLAGPAELAPDREYTDLRYYFQLALQIDAALAGQGITFLLTWHLDAFEDRFRDSVVLLVGDEKHQTASYSPAVRAIFRTGGVRSNPPSALRHLAP